MQYTVMLDWRKTPALSPGLFLSPLLYTWG